jgi:hypothetical protein
MSRENFSNFSITHHACGKTSYNKQDIAKKYCGRCHIFMAEGTYTINEPVPEEMPTGQGFWVNGIVAVRDGIPYIQLSNEKGMIAQLTMSQARQVANDIVIMCSRSEADAMIFKFFNKFELPEQAAGLLMQEFRDFRFELDEDKPERTES